LLENAIAYTPTGGKITVDLQQRDRSILVAITDTGLGIAPEDLPHIFERFWRADRARSWRAGGSGLGLAIAEAIAKNHDGNITVSSQIGSGSCFTVTFA
jgi:signal transduction histidine kinase